MNDVSLIDGHIDDEEIKCKKGFGETMETVQQYESYKQYLKSLNLSPAEYEKRLREWCRRNKF